MKKERRERVKGGGDGRVLQKKREEERTT